MKVAALVAFLSCAAPALAAEPSTGAVRVTAAGAGRSLTEAVWQTVPAVRGFVEREPREGAEPAQATEFRVAYDDTTLFVQVRAFDTEPDKIVTYLTRRDDESPCDWIRVLVDSYHDRRTAYEFAVNPDGVKQDRYWFNDTNSDISWDAVWDVTVSRDEHGWLAEFRIPFSQLRFTPSDTNTFGFAVARDVGRSRETSTWPLLARSANGYVSSFGELAGVTTGRAAKRLELTPYSVASLTRQPVSGNPLVDSSAAGASFGVDVKYALTSGLTFTASINPDFGQVEADPATVNLSAFETFFNERRPFFVEGSGNFRFDADCYDGCNNLFYSRRVGRSPHGGTLPTEPAVYTDAPLQTTILGAAKLTGRVGRYSIGVVHAVTQEEFADVLAPASLGAPVVSSRLPVEPPSSYSVARVRREFPNQSYVGVIATAVNRGGDSLETLPDHAFVGGADFDWRPAPRYSLTGFLEGSRVSGTPGALTIIQTDSRHLFQRPDLISSSLDVTRTSLSGYAAAIAFNKIGGEFVRSNSYFYARSPGFETNDLGFLRRADFRRFGNWLQLRNNRPSQRFRNRAINFNQWMAWNYDGDRLFGGFNVNGNLTWRNNWSVGAGFNRNGLGFDDRASRGGPGAYANGTREAWAWMNSDNRRKVAANLSGDVGGDAQGSSWAEFTPEVVVRPVPAVLFSIGSRINRSIADSQWVTNLIVPDAHYVFAHLDQTTVSLTGRLNYTMSPTLSLQLYAEPFVSGGDYRTFRELVDGRNLDYASRYSPFDYSYAANGNPDFNVKSFRTTNVLRWEYRPGSTLFVVWQQARENDVAAGGFRLSRDARAIFGVPPHNVFLVKLAYWLNA
jgi:hypothetical protein